MISALFVETDGCYFGLPGIDAWDEPRDARKYRGPNPVVAHPPCQRWGRFWHGSTRKPHQYKLGDDNGCFHAALNAVREFGGVLEHPADSKAWDFFGLAKPSRKGGWIRADNHGGYTCYVEQGFYGHFSRKPTWLYICRIGLPELKWGRGEQRLHPKAVEKYGYAKARRIGMCAMIGGKDKTKIRNATPIEFRDLLIGMVKKYQIEVWIPSNRTLPPSMQEVAIKGDDTAGEWVINGGVWWQNYKGQAHKKGRWMQKNAYGEPDRLPESDEVTHWRHL